MGHRPTSGGCRGAKRRSRNRGRVSEEMDGDFMDVDDATGILANAEQTAVEADIANLQVCTVSFGGTYV